MESIQELANYFVYYTTQSKVGIESRIQAAVEAIPGFLEKGWSLFEIKTELDQFAHDYPQVVGNIYHIGEIMNKKEPPNNLMDQDEFYYHNELREVSPPPRIMRDPATGEMVRYIAPFYLEMKKRFSMQDLLNYWYSKMSITATEHIMRQDEGKFKYMLTNYTLDEILFSIDVSKTLRIERQLRPLKNAFELEKYLEDAREIIQKKQNVQRMQGIDREFKRSDHYGNSY